MNREWILIALRFLSAMALFTFLGRSNVWMTPVVATVLVLGYRLGIFLTPVAIRTFGRMTTTAAFAVAALGSIAWYFGYPAIAAPLAAVGLAISGYLVKAKATRSPRGAALVAVAMNAGSLVAGVVLALGGESLELVLVGGTAILVLCAVLATTVQVEEVKPFRAATASPNGSNVRSLVAWSTLGGATGILVFSIFSVLPQTLIPAHGGALPSWYGWLVSVNAGVIVLFSLPIARWTAKHGLAGGVAPLMLGLAALTLPQFVNMATFPVAFAWVLIISIFECGLSALDHLAAQDGALLVKEACFGIGASLCVLVSRMSSGEMSGVVTGAVGLALAMIGAAAASKKSQPVAHPAAANA